MIHSDAFQSLPLAGQYLALAHGYIEGSRVLCEAMQADDYDPDYSNTRVILHLCRHAIELFLKGAISIATKSPPPKTHHLGDLMARYNEVLPSREFRFDIPFGVENPRTLDLFDDPGELSEDIHRTLDQRYRYPTDASGKAFSNPEGFIPSMFMGELDSLSKAFVQVRFRLRSVS